jgi:hypothetical protein
MDSDQFFSDIFPSSSIINWVIFNESFSFCAKAFTENKRVNTIIKRFILVPLYKKIKGLQILFFYSQTNHPLF